MSCPKRMGQFITTNYEYDRRQLRYDVITTLRYYDYIFKPVNTLKGRGPQGHCLKCLLFHHC